MPNPFGDSPAVEANPFGDSAVGGIAVEDLNGVSALPQGMTEDDAKFLLDLNRGMRTEGSFAQKRLAPAAEGAMAPSVTLPEAPEIVVPGHQLEADVLVGLYNGLKAVPEALTAPIGSVLVPLGMGEAVSPIAKAIGKAAQVYFAGDLAKAGGAEAADAISVLNDPKATNQQKVKSITKAASTLGLSGVIGVHAAKGLDFQPVKVDVMGPDGTSRQVELPAARAAKQVEDQAKAEIDNIYKQAGVERPTDVSPETRAREDLNAKIGKNPFGDEPFVEATSQAVAPEAPKAPSVPVEPEVQVTIFQPRPRPSDGKTIPGFAQIETKTNEGRGAPLTAAEKAKYDITEEQALASGLPDGQYTLKEVQDAITSTKNAQVAIERAERNLPPPEPADVRKIAEAKASAETVIRENPTAADELIADLKATDRAATDVENFILLEKQVRTEAAFKQADALARDAATPEAKAEADANLQRVSDELLDVYNVGQKAGTETARGLNARKAAVFEDFTLAQMVTLERASKGGERLTPKEASENAALHEKIATLQRQLDERTAPPEASAAKKSRIVQVLSERADAARERIKERLRSGQLSAGIDPLLIKDYAEIGAYHLARGIEKGAKWSAEMVKEFGETIKPHLDAIFAASEKTHTEALSAKADASKLAAYKTRTFNKTLETQNKAAIGDFEPTPRKKLVLDKEALLLQAKLESAQAEFAARLERNRFERLSTVGKIREEALNTYDAARNLMTTGEFSYVLRQGGVSALSHPVLAAKAVVPSFRALFSDEVTARAIDLETLSPDRNPDIKAARAAKLHLVEEGAKLSRQEEIFASKWANKLSVRKIPVLRDIPILNKTPGLAEFNQAGRVFLNKLRFDVWRAIREASDKTPAQDAQLAKFVNESTGRGSLGGAEAAAVTLGRVLFSPRFLASRIQLLVGHSMWGGDLTTRRIIAKEYAKTLVGLGVVYAMLNQLGDEKHKPAVSLDPRSSDFGKIKYGNTRLDPLMGLAQLTVFGARTATGQKTNAKGKVVPIRGPNVPYGGAKWSDVAATFARSKLHPVPGSVINLFDGTDLGGNEATVANQSLNMVAPLTYMDIYQALEEQDLPTGVSLSLLAMFGEGLQTYDATKKKPKPLKPNPANK